MVTELSNFEVAKTITMKPKLDLIVLVQKLENEFLRDLYLKVYKVVTLSCESKLQESKNGI